MGASAMGAQSELEAPPLPSFPSIFSLFWGFPMPPCLSHPRGSLSISPWVSLSVTPSLHLCLHHLLSLSGAHVKGPKSGLQEVPETLIEMADIGQSTHPVVPSHTDVGEGPSMHQAREQKAQGNIHGNESPRS